MNTQASYAPASTMDPAMTTQQVTTTTTSNYNTYPNKTVGAYQAPTATVATPYPYSLSYLSMIVQALIGWQALCFFAWFIIEIIIHSENDQFDILIQLAFQSMIIYTHEGIILMGTLFALGYADLVKTRAARVMSCAVQTFGLLAWFWELYFIIPSFRGADNSTNVFCNFYPGQDHKWCDLTRAASAMAVALQFGQSMIWLYSFANMFMIPVADDGTVKEVEEVDDAEVDAFVAAQPAVYGVADAAEKATGLAILGLVGFSLCGYAILVLSSIKISSDTGLSYILSDVALSDMFRQLSLLLVFALAASSYSALRRNRCITAGALFLTILSSWQWWSFFIEACRRFHAIPDASNPNGNYLNDASKAVIAGAGIICCIETIRCLGLLSRYYFYVPVQKTHLVPTYQTGAFDFVNPIFTLIFITEFFATFAWWVLQFVLESDTRLFNDDPATNSVLVTERMFIYQCCFFAAVFLPAFYAEKWRNVGSYYSALMVNCVIMLGYFLLVWPWSYHTIFTNGALMNGMYTNGFCFNNPDNYGHDICRLVQGAAVLSAITGLLYVVLALYQICRIMFFGMDPVDGTATVNPDGTMVAQLGLPPVERKNEFVNLSIVLMICGLAIWALSSIDSITSTNQDAFNAYSNQNHPIVQTNSGSNTNANFDVFYSYMYTIAYPVIVSLAFTTWVACEVAQNAYSSNRFGWRLLLVGLSTLCFFFYVPGLIYVARYVHDGSLNSVQKAEAAGWFILSGCSFLLLIAAWVHMLSDYIPVPDRTATVITRDVQLNDVKVDPLNKGAEIGRAAGIADGYAIANQRDIADTTVVENRDASYNSTVNVH